MAMECVPKFSAYEYFVHSKGYLQRNLSKTSKRMRNSPTPPAITSTNPELDEPAPIGRLTACSESVIERRTFSKQKTHTGIGAEFVGV